MENKVCIITGATDGIGKATAKKLIEHQYHIVLIGRDLNKGANVKHELEILESSSNVDFIQCDLSLMCDIDNLAIILKNKYNNVDILINNAGGYFSKKTLTDEGLESTFALNHLAYFHLTNLLLDHLKKQNNCRIINVASDAHFGGDIDFNNLQGEQDYNGWNAYRISKLMNIMFSYFLAEKLSETNITVNCLHPGFVASRFGNNNTGMSNILIRIAKSLAAISVEKGSRTSVFLATSPDVNNITGKYFHKCNIKPSSGHSYKRDNWKMLWKLSEEILDKINN